MPVVLDQRAQSGREAPDVGHVGEHVVRGHQVGPAVGAGDLATGGGTEELDLGRDAPGPGRLRDVRRGLDAEHRDARRLEMLQQVAVVAGDLGDETAGGESKPFYHGLGVALRMRDPRVGIRRKVGIVGKDLLTGHVCGKLHEQAAVA